MVSVNLTSSTQGPPRDVAIGVLIHRYSSHCVGPEVPKSNVSTHRRQRERTTPRISSIYIYDMCVCVKYCGIIKLIQIATTVLYFSTIYISPSVCLSVRVDWPDQACCASISPSKGPRSFAQLDSWWTLVHSGDLRRSQATVIAVMAWNQLNMFWTCLII